MVIILNLGGGKAKSNEFTTCVNNQHYITSFFHKVMGKDNNIHDKFSEYAISSLQGGLLINNSIHFENGAYVFISSPSSDVLDNFLSNVYKHINSEIYSNSDIYLRGVSILDFRVGTYFDKIQTISPIRLKNKADKEITFKDDEFISLLNEKMREKLKRHNPNLNLNGFSIEPFKIENAKQKLVSVKRGVYSKCSYMRFIVRGNMEVRRLVYLLGLGQSTGCGFGSIKVL